MNTNHCSHKNCNNRNFYNYKCIFHCEKLEENNWFIFINNEKKWNQEFIVRFWEEIRNKKMAKKDYDFSYFIFPKFEYKYILFENLEEPIITDFGRINNNFIDFEKDISFINSKFLDYTFLGNISFEKNLNLSNAIFYKDLNFSSSEFSTISFNTDTIKPKFKGDVVFENTVFNEDLEINNITFEKDLLFGETEFRKKVSLNGIEIKGVFDCKKTKFKNDVFIFYSNFKKKVRFNEAHFFKNIDFDELIFSDNLFFINTLLKKNISFFGITFSENSLSIFEEIKFKDSKFQNINFPEKTLFRNCDLSEVSFLDSNIEKVQFDECKFLKSPQGNSMLYDEKKNENFEAVENLYRQFKQNFDKKGDYQKADDFYVGEMEMMKKKLKKNIKFNNWGKLIILTFYKLISNYNSSPFLALGNLILIILIFSFFYQFFPEINPPKVINFMDTLNFSISNSIPFVDPPMIEYKIDGKLIKEAYAISGSLAFFLITIQKIISTGIILLFGLSLRRKFKR